MKTPAPCPTNPPRSPARNAHAAMRHPLLLLALALALPAAATAGTVHVHTSDAAGFRTHSVWYDDGREVTVVDAQFTPAHAQRLIEDIRSHTASPITRVIVTHPNPDKFNGLSAFHAIGATSIASARTAAAMPEVHAYKRHFWVDVAHAFSPQEYPALAPVGQTFEQRLQLRLASGETLSLIELPGPGVSAHQTVVRIDATGDLVVGDLVHARHHAWLEGAIEHGRAVTHLTSWRADLAALPTLGQGTLYGGRGQFLPVNQATREQIDYLEQVERITRDYLAQLGERRRELTDPATRRPHEQALQARIAQAFPGHEAPEMLSYSLYGLIQTLANPSQPL